MIRTILIACVTLSAATAWSLPLPGGGSPETDCHVEFASTRMKLNYPPFNPRAPEARTEVRCFDGDAGCDLDGEVNGQCTFDVDVCLRNADPDLPECVPQDISAASSSLESLGTALAGILPATETACTDGQTEIVNLGREVASVTVAVSATTSGDVTDADQVIFTCVPHGWPTHGFSYANHRSNPMEESIDVSNVGALGIKWRFDLAGAGLKSVTSTPAVGNGMVYFTSWNRRIYALDQATGDVVWEYANEAANFLGLEGSPTLTADGRVLITADQTLECLDARDGTLLWSTLLTDNAQMEMWGAARVANNRVFVGLASKTDSPCAFDGQLVAADLDTGEVLWRFITTPEKICRTDTSVICNESSDCPGGGECLVAEGAGITAQPSVDPTGEIVFANTVGCLTFPSIGDSDSILSFVAATGELRWKNRVRPPEQFGFCREENNTECRDDDDCPAGGCRSKGVFHDFGFLNGPLYIAEGEAGIGRSLVVSGSKDGSLYALDSDTGEHVWTNEVVPVPVSPGLAAWGLFNGAIAYSSGHIYAGLHDVSPTVGPAHLQAFRVTDGMTAWTQDFERTWSDTTVANGVMFVGDCGSNGTCRPDCGEEGVECGPGAYYAVDASDGRILKRFEMPAPIRGGSAIVDGVAYSGYGLSGTFGGVVALAIACPGDCNFDGRPEVHELTLGVRQALGLPVSEGCEIFDRNADGRVAVAELVLAVRAALDGCQG